MTLLTTPEQQKAGRIEQNQQHHYTQEKCPVPPPHSSPAMPSASPTHGTDVPCARPQEQLTSASMQRHARLVALDATRATEAPGKAASSTIHP